MAGFPATRSSPVSRLMNPSPVKVSPGDPATRVRSIFRSTGARVVYVVDRDGRLLGWITRREILYITSSKSTATAQSLMDEPPVTLHPHDRVGDAVSKMLRVDEWYAPVTDSGRLLGSLGLENVMASMVEEDPDSLASVRLEDIMSRDTVTVSPEDSVSSLWRKMEEYRYSGVPVVDEKGRLLGIVTVYDLLSEAARLAFESSSGPLRGPRVREVMTSPATYLYPWSSALDAAKLMVERGYGRIPVVESERTRRLVGIVDREDIVKLML